MASPVITLRLNARDTAGPTIQKVRNNLRGLENDLSSVQNASPSIRGVDRDLQRLERTSQRTGSVVSGIFHAIGHNIVFNLSMAGDALRYFVTSSVTAYGTLQGLRDGFAATLGSVEAADAAIQNFRNIAELPGIDFSNAIRFGNILQGIGLDARRVNNILVETGNLVALAGLGRLQLERGLTALQQIVTRGQFQAEERNQLIEAIPAFAGVLQEVFGTLDTEAITAQVGTGRENLVENFLDPLLAGLSARGRADADNINNLISNQHNIFREFQQEFGRILEPFARDILRASQTLLTGTTNFLRGIEGFSAHGLAETVGGAGIAGRGTGLLAGVLAARGAASAATSLEPLTQATNAAVLQRLGASGAGAATSATARGLSGVLTAAKGLLAPLRGLGRVLGPVISAFTKFSGILTAVGIGLEAISFLSLRGQLDQTRGLFSQFTDELTRFTTHGDVIRVINRQIADVTQNIREFREELNLKPGESIPETTIFGAIRDFIPFIGTGGRRVTQLEQLRISESDLSRLQERGERFTPDTGVSADTHFRSEVSREVRRLREIRRRPQEIQRQIERLEGERREIEDRLGGLQQQQQNISPFGSLYDELVISPGDLGDTRRELVAIIESIEDLTRQYDAANEVVKETDGSYRAWNNLLSETSRVTSSAGASIEESTTQVRELGRALRGITTDDALDVIERTIGGNLEGVSQRVLDTNIANITRRLEELNEQGEKFSGIFSDFNRFFDATNITDATIFTRLEEEARSVLATMADIRRSQAEIVHGVEPGGVLPVDVENVLIQQEFNEAIELGRVSLAAYNQALDNNLNLQVQTLRIEIDRLETQRQETDKAIRESEDSIARAQARIDRIIADEIQRESNIQSDQQSRRNNISPRGRRASSVLAEFDRIDDRIGESIENQRSQALSGVTVRTDISDINEANQLAEDERGRIEKEYDRRQEIRRQNASNVREAFERRQAETLRDLEQQQLDSTVNYETQKLRAIENTYANRVRIQQQTVEVLVAEEEAYNARLATINDDTTITLDERQARRLQLETEYNTKRESITLQAQNRIDKILVASATRTADTLRQIRIRDLQQAPTPIQLTGDVTDTLQIASIRERHELELANLAEIGRLRVEAINEQAERQGISEDERAARVQEVDQQINTQREQAINNSRDLQLRAIESIRSGFVSIGNTLFDTLVTGPIRQQRLFQDISTDREDQIREIREDPSLSIEEQERRIFEIRQRYAEREEELNQEVARSRIDSVLNASRIVVNTAIETFSRIAAIRASESLLGLAPSSNVGIAGGLGTLGLGASIGGIGAIVAGIALTGLLVSQSKRFHDPINDLLARSGGRDLARELVTNERQSARDYIRETNEGVKREIQIQRQREGGQVGQQNKPSVMAIPVQSLQDLIISTTGTARRELEAFEMIPV